MKLGDKVKHKSTNFILVVVRDCPEDEHIIQCRYFNDVTGKYETEEFNKCEFEG